MPKAGGKWNTYEITAKGSQLTVVLNGVQTVNIQNCRFAQGPFGSRRHRISLSPQRSEVFKEDDRLVDRATSGGTVTAGEP
jgi:hypothetical protein